MQDIFWICKGMYISIYSNMCVYLFFIADMCTYMYMYMYMYIHMVCMYWHYRIYIYISYFLCWYRIHVAAYYYLHLYIGTTLTRMVPVLGFITTECHIGGGPVQRRQQRKGWQVDKGTNRDPRRCLNMRIWWYIMEYCKLLWWVY